MSPAGYADEEKVAMAVVVGVCEEEVAVVGDTIEEAMVVGG